MWREIFAEVTIVINFTSESSHEYVVIDIFESNIRIFSKCDWKFPK